jgi:hypothetical protein
MALWARRHRQEEHAALLARGELVWTTTFDRAARNRLRFAFVDSVSEAAPYAVESVAHLARGQILWDEGLPTLTGQGDHNSTNDVLELPRSSLDRGRLTATPERCSPAVSGLDPTGLNVRRAR